MLFCCSMKKKYFTEKWIADQNLVTIFINDYGLDFAVKRFINRYLPHLLFDGINIYHEIKRNIIDNDGNKARVTFYFFTRHNKIPEKFVTTEAWQNAYENFRFLRSNRNTNTTKRTLQDLSNITLLF